MAEPVFPSTMWVPDIELRLGSRYLYLMSYLTGFVEAVYEDLF